jgi:hypothetical protein
VDIIDDHAPGEDAARPRRLIIDGREVYLPSGSSISLSLLRLGDDTAEVMITVPARRVRVGYGNELHTRLDEYLDPSSNGTIAITG